MHDVSKCVELNGQLEEFGFKLIIISRREKSKMKNTKVFPEKQNQSNLVFGPAIIVFT